MRLPNFTTAMVLSIAACLGTLQRADAQGPMQDSMQATDVDAGFGVENNGGYHKFPCTQIDLVCDHIVIDSITCRPHNMAGIAAVFSKTNRCPKKECQKITRIKYVQMDEPCYKRPTDCPSFVPSDNFDADSAIGDGSEGSTDNTDDTGDTDDTDDNDDDNSDADMNDAGLDAEPLQLQKRNNDGHKKNHRNRHHHHKKPHPHRKHKHHHKTMKHPWAGLCVAKGEFCGANLFGCDFISKAAYVCDKVGATPRFRTFCRSSCKDGICDTTPSPSASASVSASVSASASPSPTTPVDPCKLLADTLLGLIEILLSILDAVADLLPGVLQTVVKQLIADLRDFLTVAVNDIAELAAAIVSLEPIVKLLRDVSRDIAAALGLPTGFLDPLLAALDSIITTAGSLIGCEGVPKDCRGLLTIVGSLLKAGLTLIGDLIDDTLGPILGAPIKIVLGQISALVDNVIQGLPGAVAAIQLLLAPLSLAINAVPGLPAVLTLPFQILIDLINALSEC